MTVLKLDSTRDPETMTTEERFGEIASILAVGVYRELHDSKTKNCGIDLTWRPTQNLQVSTPQVLENPTYADLSVSADDPSSNPQD
jgi:hypothetical protein